MRCTTDFFLHVVDRAAHLPADCHSQITIRQKRRLSKDRHAYIFALVAIYISRLWMSQFILHTFECTPLPDAEYKVVNKDLPHFSSWRDHLGCLGTWQPCPVVCTFVIHPDLRVGSRITLLCWKWNLCPALTVLISPHPKTILSSTSPEKSWWRPKR